MSQDLVSMNESLQLIASVILQACFRGETQARTFMSASLLVELTAIETMMIQKAKEVNPDNAQAAETPRSQDEDLDELTMTSPVTAEMAETEIESDHACAICLVRHLTDVIDL